MFYYVLSDVPLSCFIIMAKLHARETANTLVTNVCAPIQESVQVLKF